MDSGDVEQIRVAVLSVARPEVVPREGGIEETDRDRYACDESTGATP